MRVRVHHHLPGRTRLRVEGRWPECWRAVQARLAAQGMEIASSDKWAKGVVVRHPKSLSADAIVALFAEALAKPPAVLANTPGRAGGRADRGYAGPAAAFSQDLRSETRRILLERRRNGACPMRKRQDRPCGGCRHRTPTPLRRERDAGTNRTLPARNAARTGHHPAGRHAARFGRAVHRDRRHPRRGRDPRRDRSQTRRSASAPKMPPSG